VLTVELLTDEVLDEELLSERVDVNQVAAEFLTPFLAAVERRHLVDQRVSRALLTAAGEHRPTGSI